MTYIPAFFVNTFASRMDALLCADRYAVDHSATPLAEGAELFLSRRVAVVLAPAGDHTFQLWVSRKELWRSSLETARADLEKYEADWFGGWRIFTGRLAEPSTKVNLTHA